MITKDQARSIADVFLCLADLYDAHVLEKIRVRCEPGNNMIIEWDDMSEDDRDAIMAST